MTAGIGRSPGRCAAGAAVAAGGASGTPAAGAVAPGVAVDVREANGRVVRTTDNADLLGVRDSDEALPESALAPAHLVPGLVLTGATPPRTGALPASKPGLDAGDRYLGGTIADRGAPAGPDREVPGVRHVIRVSHPVDGPGNGRPI